MSADDEVRNLTMNLRCTINDNITCTRCNRTLRVSRLVAVNGATIPKIGNPKECWQQVFYYCQCDLEKPLVYDPGDGDLVVVYLSHAQLAE